MLDTKQVMIIQRVEARKQRFDADAAWKMLQTATSVTTAKGKKVRAFNPKSDDKAEILKQAIGPSGNLRVPALRINDTFVIGFNEELYEELF